MNAPTKKLQAAVPTNTREMRAFLVDQMMAVSEGSVESEKAKSICNLSQQIYNTLNVEIKMAIAKDKINGGEIAAVGFGS